jgi:hypothetical protein
VRPTQRVLAELLQRSKQFERMCHYSASAEDRVRLFKHGFAALEELYSLNIALKSQPLAAELIHNSEAAMGHVFFTVFFDHPGLRLNHRIDLRKTTRMAPLYRDGLQRILEWVHLCYEHYPEYWWLWADCRLMTLEADARSGEATIDEAFAEISSLESDLRARHEDMWPYLDRLAVFFKVFIYHAIRTADIKARDDYFRKLIGLRRKSLSCAGYSWSDPRTVMSAALCVAIWMMVNAGGDNATLPSELRDSDELIDVLIHDWSLRKYDPDFLNSGLDDILSWNAQRALNLNNGDRAARLEILKKEMLAAYPDYE